MRTYLLRLLYALQGKPLPSSIITVELRVETVHSVQVVQKPGDPVTVVVGGGPVIQGGGGPTDPGKPR